MKRTTQRMVDGIFSILLLVVANFFLYRLSVTTGIVFSFLIAVYILMFFARGAVFRFRFYHNFSGDELPSVVSATLNELDVPVMIVSDDNKIYWANICFEDLPEMGRHIRLPGADSIFDGSFTYDNLSLLYESEKYSMDVQTKNGPYSVQIVKIFSKSKRCFYATLWIEKNDEALLKKKCEDENTIVALIAVDNASELSQNGDETFRLASAKINVILTEWAKTLQAILMEYEDGKFMLLFDHRSLCKMIENKFEIIDRVSELSSDSYTFPLTISIGVSEEAGSLMQKQSSAQNALRIALQKGGAFAVVKTADGYHAYGGRTKTVQKQTSIRSRICRDLLVNNIRTSSNVLIMGHRRPDFDSIASNIGIAKLATFLGKTVHIVTDRNEKNIENAFTLLKDVPEYDDMFVDARRGLDLMNPYTLLIITDASNPKNFYSEELYLSAQRVIVIDHHTLDQHLGDNVLTPVNIDPNASSASELICEILELSVPDGSIRKQEAQLLLIGILLDTQFFSRDTGSRTFRACSYLRSIGADPAKAKLLFKTELEEFDRIASFDKTKYVYRDKFMICSYDEDSDPENMVAAAKAAERLVGINGIVASFALYSLESGISVSARSDGTFNVVNIVGRLGGGGHFQSAGARLNNSGVPIVDMDEARFILESAIDAYLNS